MQLTLFPRFKKKKEKKKTAHYPRFLLLAQSDTLGKHFMERGKLDLR